MSKKNKGYLHLLLLAAAIIGFGYLAYISMPKIKLGLDLAGGVSITYRAVEENPSDEDMQDTIHKLGLRVDNYSTENEVYREGSNRINIDIPGVSDANAILEELGKPGSLSFVGPSGDVILTGDQVDTAKAVATRDKGQPTYYVELVFTPEGTKAFADATSKYIGQQISIIYDNQVHSAPVVQNAITDGRAVITGMNT